MDGVDFVDFYFEIGCLYCVWRCYDFDLFWGCVVIGVMFDDENYRFV